MENDIVHCVLILQGFSSGFTTDRRLLTQKSLSANLQLMMLRCSFCTSETIVQTAVGKGQVEVGDQHEYGA